MSPGTNYRQIIDRVFDESLREKRIEILKHFVSDLRYNEAVVRSLLEHYDPVLLAGLLEHSDPSFNILFVKLVLQHAASSQGLLARIIPSLYFTPNPGIAPDLLAKIEENKEEIRMLVDASRIPAYEVCCAVKAELREYQREGVRWMAFLNRFGLNGILADDMGLGKTLQIMTYMVSEMQRCSAERAGEKSLIVCPSSLTTHWKDEILGYFGRKSCVYNGKTKALDEEIVIATYDQLRKDAGVLTGERWFMLVMDEGHLLKSRSTVLYAKASAIDAGRRFILTGTPVHNSVDDLFSLFNLVMPGYLGTEAEFGARYGLKITDKNVDVMEERLQNLHKKILPFVLRRLKSEVLKDLPPKIIKDVVVELSAGHMELYRSIKGETQEEQAGGYAALKSTNALTYTKNLLKAASHPGHFGSDAPSSKTAALRDIFAMCGERKVLVFFQLRKTIDFVVEELELEGNYLRLDGSVPQSQRGDVVSRFNTESIQFLFLTTALGGLGLNLVSADTVVFYEHDWNPFNDLQAMDRAHRLGQKRVVNVFRLISKATVEETVMNYQNFKVYVASSIVTQQNTDIERMDTKDLLERFQ
ncbi:TATA-binding protein-associated factor [Pancytospora philotis]|nr:TATA-binding protein-associated factor [Pancytospora philotis]